MCPVKKKDVAKEILAILQAEYECAESLKATSVEIERLMQQGDFDLMGERLHARGEILNLMLSLDKQWNELAKCYSGSKESPEWQTACEKGEALRVLMNEMIRHGSQLQNDATVHLDETGDILKTFYHGKKVINQYTRESQSLKRPQPQGALS